MGVMTEVHGHTHRLDLADSTVREWDATVLAVDPEQGIVLDRSAFYPGGGGQPPDEGVLLWGGVRTRIAGTRKGDELYLIPVEGDPVPPVGTAVRGALDDERRTALMRTHSGLHVLTGVVFRDFGALVTGGNMEPLKARMDFELAAMSADFAEAVEAALHQEVAADRPVHVSFLTPAEFAARPELIRTKTNLLPPGLELVRVIDIDGLDRQADGGTHVARTGEVGAVQVVGHQSKGKGNKRLRIALDAVPAPRPRGEG
jgi:misacylated tRNA(Ala) deacylase